MSSALLPVLTPSAGMGSDFGDMGGFPQGFSMDDMFGGGHGGGNPFAGHSHGGRRQQNPWG